MEVAGEAADDGGEQVGGEGTGCEEGRGRGGARARGHGHGLSTEVFRGLAPGQLLGRTDCLPGVPARTAGGGRFATAELHSCVPAEIPP
ncbi:hypothetical protein GCM10023235_27980 [Kitasatospora terrestris]|uniref:Uncharacterized protein n=1 Tax=Kitasatospora terrestris TaxID=258051 RepID=A0ABP9DMZ1_9ACTN